MDSLDIRLRYGWAFVYVERPPVKVVNVALPDPFVRSDWQIKPRKLKKQVKRRMLELNEMLQRREEEGGNGNVR